MVGVDGAGRTHRLGLVAAAGGPVHRVDPDTGPAEVEALLAGAGAGTVLVDDAHRLPAEVAAVLAAAARRGVRTVVARRPSLTSPQLADLDAAASAQGGVEMLVPLDVDAVAALVAAVTGKPASPETAAAVHRDSSGLPALVVALAQAPDDPVPAALAARVQRQLAVLPEPAVRLAQVLALESELPDEALAAAVGVAVDGLPELVQGLYEHGLLLSGAERLIPAVARAVRAGLSPAAERQLHDRVARALTATGADPAEAARRLTAARVRSPEAAEVYRRAADELRFRDPAAALRWYDDAAASGAPPETVAAGRAEAAALLGQPVDPDLATSADASRLRLVTGAVAAHQGRAGRAAEALLAAGPPGPALAVPSLVSLGRLAEARTAADGEAPTVVRLLAEAALAVADPPEALPRFIEAAEQVEAAAPALVLPDTPHALGAVVAVTAGDPWTAEHLLERAGEAAVGGPVAADRHRLLRAWVDLRRGRYQPALDVLSTLAPARLSGRERLLLAALSAGVARRSGDIARLRASWQDAEPVLARRAVDLFQVEPLEELLVAASRLRQRQRVEPVLATLEAILDGLGRPPAWVVTVGWIRLQLTVGDDDAAAADAVAADLSGLQLGVELVRQRVQVAAARQWARVLGGDVDADEVTRVADELAAVHLPWEASRLVGDAAIRTGDPAVARRLLERARELSAAEAATGPRATGGLSERELEVARLVLAGRTHREIGSQLFLSPKTVEHHVARIRTKLGATSRAELIAALRKILEEDTA